MSQNNLSHLIWRAAIKQYDSSKKLTPEQLLLLTDAARLAPTSYGMQPIKLYVVSNEEIKKELRKNGYDQPQFTNASHIIIFAARTNIEEKDVNEFIQRVSEQRNVPIEKLNDFKQMLLGSGVGKTKEELHNWAAKQAYIALGISLDVAAYNKIDTTPIEGFNPEEFDKILNIKDDGFTSVVVLAAGFREQNDKYTKMPKVRKTVEEFVTELK